MRNLVFCSDGTSNTFDGETPTNVARLVDCLDLDTPARQRVWYDPGVGTTSRRRRPAEPGNHGPGLTMLPSPDDGWPAVVGGLLVGRGLKENVRSLYAALADAYTGDDDRVFLVGFSRGAFTVRVVAGLIYRCGLPHAGETDVFDRAWTLLQPVRPEERDRRAEQEMRRRNRPCPVHLLGLWDTVKSYGGLYPVLLPHLRHNPIVAHVRHALALDERRAWFKATSWGRLDSDRATAMTRIDPADLAAVEAQDVGEVWFTGCHTDIGAGDVTLRWMLGEVAHLPSPLLLSGHGRARLGRPDPLGPPPVHESQNLRWRAVEQLPRLEPDNGDTYPRRVRHRGSDGARHPQETQRNGVVTVHATAAERVDALLARVVETRTP